MKAKLMYFLLVLFLSSSMVLGQYIGTGSSSYHTVIAKSDGQVYTWGRNDYGQLGDNTTEQRTTPVTIVSIGSPIYGKIITQIAGGQFHTVALANDGTVYTWGRNDYGQLGDNTTERRMKPVAVYTTGTPMAGKKIVQVCAGFGYTVALASDGTIYAWGDNINGQLGNNSTTASNVPVAVYTTGTPMAGKTISKISAGWSHTVALSSDGSVYTWGDDYYGQLGDNNTVDQTIPVAVHTTGTPMAGKTIIQVVAGTYHTVALSNDGKVYTWGWNYYGQLGDNTLEQRMTPVAVYTTGTPMDGKTITQIGAGQYHTIALANNGMLFSWGANGNGQLGDSSLTQRKVPVAVKQSSMGLLPIELDMKFEKKYKLYQNFPNPFNPVTKISYNIPVSGNVKLSIYDVLGKEVMEVFNGYQEAGYKEISVDCSRLSTGVYYYKLESGNYKEVKKMMLIK